MGSKAIIFLGVLLSALYLYFSVSQYAAKNRVMESEISAIQDKDKAPIINETELETAEEATPTIPEDDVVIPNADERISIPAFGFMSGVNKSQIVALMSDNDENGTLVKKIKALCKKAECSKDMRFEKDIKDALWQEDVAKVIGLLADGKIENGSLFIEGNVLKLEGTIVDEETEGSLKTIFENIQDKTIKIENFTKLSPTVVKQEDNSTQKESVEAVKAEKSEETKEETQKIEKESTPAAVPEKKPESKKVEPVKKVTKSVEKVEKKVVNVKPAPKASKTPKTEVVPTAVMETTLDAESRVRNILNEIKDNTPESGTVAKPKLNTTAE